MTCCRCKRTITAAQKHRYLAGAGDIHEICPPDPQETLFGDDEKQLDNADAGYGEWD